MALTRSERALLKELRPYKVLSLANGHLSVEPTWRPVGSGEGIGEGVGGVLSRMTLADIVERILNEQGDRRTADRRLGR